MAADVADRLARGDRLYMGLGSRGRFWWFENRYQIVSDQRLARLGDRVLVEAGDSLFGWRGNSQTWLAVKGPAQ